MNPDIADVHIPQPIKTKKKKNDTENYILNTVPIFKSGIWQGLDFSLNDIDDIVKNTNALIKSKLLEPVVKLGHNDEQKLLKNDGYPAAGYIYNVYRIGDQIFADIKDMPKKVYELIEKKAYKNVSAEIAKDYPHPITKEPLNYVLVGVAILGADLPAVKGLGDILNLYNSESAENLLVINFSQNFLKEAKFMKKENCDEKKTWTLDEIKEKIPCCSKKIEKLFTEKELKEITTDELAKIVFEEQLKNQNKQTDPIKCPPGFKWDDKESRCIPSDTTEIKPEAQKVCPEGFEWNEAESKCVEIRKETENKKFDAELILKILKALGYEVEDIPEDESKIDEWAEKIKTKKQETDKKDKENIDLKDLPDFEKITKEDVEKIKQEKEYADLDIKTFPERPPKAWWNACVKSVTEKGVADDPERLCGWIWHHGKSEAEKAKATKEYESEKIKELKEKIIALEKQKFNETIEKIIAENRGVLLPAFDNYIKTFAEYFSQDDKIIRFSDTEIKVKDLFAKFLQEIVNKKSVVFSELTKDYEKEKEIENIEVTEEEIEKIKLKFSEQGKKLIGNEKLAILAEKISLSNNISYRDALVKARKILEKNQ